MLTNHKEYGDGPAPAFSTGILEIKEPVTYRWNGTGFQRVTELDPKEQNSLTLKNGKFYVTKNCYDNQKNQFTLVEVAYKDPAEPSKGAYHLYIPVIVKKVMEFKFWAATQIGTNYWTSAYDNLSTSTVASHGDKVTVLMGFEYQRTIAEWEKAINDGENLLWNFDKKVFIRNIASQEGSAFPNGTYLTLVDRSNRNKAFFAKLGDGSSPLSAENMLTFSAFPGWSQEEIPLCDRLDLTATADSGTFISLDSSEGATIRAKLDGKMTYFRLATADDASDLPRYGITVGIEGLVREEYYLTIQTPAGDSSFVNVGFECPNKIPIDGNLGLATKRIDNIGNDGKKRPYSRSGSENQLIMADFFVQEFTIESDSPALISPGSNTIIATLRTALKFKDGMKQKYQTWADNQTLYQSFDIYLVEQNDDIQIPRNFANETTLSYSYSGGPSDSVVLTGSESSYRICADSMVVSSGSIPNEGIVQEATIYLTYTNAGIIEQFPIQPTSESSIGILICANSDWAYTKPALEYTSLHKPGQDAPPTLYHRDEASGVTLTYNAYQDISGSQSKGLSQLGVNGLEKSSFDISTAGLYDASTLKDVESARYLRCTLTLHPKVSQGNYGNAVTLGNYLTKALISAKVTNTNGQLVNATVLGSDATSQDIHSSGSIVFSLGDSFDHSIPIQLPIDLTVITGTAFEGQSFTYANYRVKLIVELLDENQGVIAYSTADDYIIYTNAKVLLGMVTPET